MFPFDISLVLRRDIDVSMGTSPIMPCYDVERLATKTHVGLGPGGSIKYTKHRVSLEGNWWPGCCPEETPGVHIVMDRPSKEGLEQSWSSEPESLLLKQKGLWLARRDIQVVKCRKRYDLGSEQSGDHLRYITQPWFREDLRVVRPKFQPNRVDGKGLQVSYSLD